MQNRRRRLNKLFRSQLWIVKLIAITKRSRIRSIIIPIMCRFRTDTLKWKDILQLHNRKCLSPQSSCYFVVHFSVTQNTFSGWWCTLEKMPRSWRIQKNRNKNLPTWKTQWTHISSVFLSCSSFAQRLLHFLVISGIQIISMDTGICTIVIKSTNMEH